MKLIAIKYFINTDKLGDSFIDVESIESFDKAGLSTIIYLKSGRKYIVNMPFEQFADLLPTHFYE